MVRELSGEVCAGLAFQKLFDDPELGGDVRNAVAALQRMGGTFRRLAELQIEGCGFLSDEFWIQPAVIELLAERDQTDRDRIVTSAVSLALSAERRQEVMAELDEFNIDGLSDITIFKHIGKVIDQRGRVDSAKSVDEVLAEARAWMTRKTLLAEISSRVENRNPPSDPQKPANRPLGLSLRDVAAALSQVQGDFDPTALDEARVRWNNTKQRTKQGANKLPKMLGKCATNNRDGLFGLSAMLEFVKKEDGLSELEIREMKRHLKPRLRPIGNR